MGTPVRHIIIGVIFACLVNAVVPANDEDQLICTGDTFYKVKKNGRAICKECPSCIGGGIGWNTTEKRLEDEHGFRSCYNCDVCKPGTYRELDSYSSKCQPCGLDCSGKNRYGSVKCGGSSPGHCGECFTGYYASSKEPNSWCKRKLSTAMGYPVTISGVTTPDQRFEKNGHGENTNASIPIWIPYGIMFILIAVIIVLAVIAALCVKEKKKKQESGIAFDSKRALISNGSSLDEDCLETDGDVKTRGELPEAVTINELEAMGFKQCSLSERLEALKCDRVLRKDDKTLDTVANNIHGERRHEFFETYLRLEKSKTSPHEEKFHKNIYTFPEYILEVLKIWLQIANKGATLKALCTALEMASFHDVVEKVLDLPENQPSEYVDDIKQC